MKKLALIIKDTMTSNEIATLIELITPKWRTQPSSSLNPSDSINLVANLSPESTTAIVKDTMSSLEIAGLTGKQHKNVMRDIRETLRAVDIDGLKFELLETRGINKGKVKLYNLPRRECDLIVSGYSPKYRLAIIDRWQALEIENALLRQQEQARVADRQAARLECPMMTDAVKEIRGDAGKKTSFFHYSNEMDMINRIVLGSTAKKFRVENEVGGLEAIRDFLSPYQIKMVQILQEKNTTLIQCDLTFKDRKTKLAAYYRREEKKMLLSG